MSAARSTDALDALVHQQRPEPHAVEQFIDALVSGDLGPEHAGAFAAAVMVNGLTDDALVALTTAMAGDSRLLSETLAGDAVGKHSTGGVGDKLSLVAVPIVAACGVPVPKLSGRALNHCGGTIDKLAAIPGMRTDLPRPRLLQQFQAHGCFIAQASADAAPGDKILYGIRQAVYCVDSIELIASSIMAKKVAEGTRRLFLDVRSGPAGLIADHHRAVRLARAMARIAHGCGIEATAHVTFWDRPLGRAVGPTVEVHEAHAVLQGHGPADVAHEAQRVAGGMLALAARDPDQAADALATGRALRAFEAMVAAQGGDLDSLPQPRNSRHVVASRGGVVAAIDPRAVGLAVAAMAEQRNPVTDTTTSKPESRSRRHPATPSRPVNRSPS
jgi:thymidine phosphorylase